jgi:hypothetical protein
MKRASPDTTLFGNENDEIYENEIKKTQIKIYSSSSIVAVKFRA